MSDVAFVRDDLVSDPAAGAGATITLRASRCPACGRAEFPRLPDCPACGGACEQVALGPKATLAGFTEVLHLPPGAQVDAPYTIAVGAFEENLAVLGLLDHHVASDELEIGAPLEVCVVRTGAGLTYGFRLP